jgi:fructose-1-phosphate kinase PfkB-like protein
MAAEEAIVTVTLHAVIDMTFTVPNFAAGSTMRAEHATEFAAGKGVSVSLALHNGPRLCNHHTCTAWGQRTKSKAKSHKKGNEMK